jgi:nitrile hydratase
MGGMMGFGPIAPEADEPVFHAPWEARVLALTRAVEAWGRSNIDAGRHARELQPPAQYLAWSYYQSWFERLVGQVVAQNLVTEAELASGEVREKLNPPLTAGKVSAMLGAGNPSAREVGAAGFKVGDRVRARTINPAGHTRLPRYVRGRVGTIERDHGGHVLPDTNAHFRGECPERLYGVRFTGEELWGEHGRDSVHLDLWESYLEPA